jgi:hypothetical protein
MKQFDIIWITWLILVCCWNFIWPQVPPIADVGVAVVLSILAYQLKQKNKK